MSMFISARMEILVHDIVDTGNTQQNCFDYAYYRVDLESATIL